MAPARPPQRVFVLTAAVLGGLIIGLLVVATLTGSRQPATYRPFFAGMKESRVQNIREGGPVLIPDPKGGDRTFYLDLEGNEIVALHVVPPGGSGRCPVQYDHQQQRYEDCDGRPVARERKTAARSGRPQATASSTPATIGPLRRSIGSGMPCGDRPGSGRSVPGAVEMPGGRGVAGTGSGDEGVAVINSSAA